MTKYIEKERAKYWPVSKELMAKYKDGSHTNKYLDGSLAWHQNGLAHRDGDKPAIIDADGTLEWFQNDKWHRDDDKPAVIDADSRLDWFQNDYHHRICGPAVIYSDDTFEWWINGENITLEVNEWLNGEKWRGTSEQIAEFKLKFL